jgi:hypothetical protein
MFDQVGSSAYSPPSCGGGNHVDLGVYLAQHREDAARLLLVLDLDQVQGNRAAARET